MKSAFELALERSGGRLNELSSEKKAEIAKIDQIYQAKIAEANLSADQKLKKETDPEKIQEIKEGLLVEIASLKEKSERAKEEVRNA